MCICLSEYMVATLNLHKDLTGSPMEQHSIFLSCEFIQRLNLSCVYFCLLSCVYFCLSIWLLGISWTLPVAALY